jgi:outer membrane immunogenic protein
VYNASHDDFTGYEDSQRDLNRLFCLQEIHMKKLLLASVAGFGILAAGAASAADLPRRTAPAAPYAAVPFFTWTGFYVGVNGGYNWADNKNRVIYNQGTLPAASAGLLPGSYPTDGDGFTGGAQLGYNYQIGQFVVGVETDINYVDSDQTSGATLGVAALGLTGVSTARSELSYLGTVRGRLGFAYDRALIYVTGGLAYGEVKNSASFSVAGLGATWGGSKSDTQTGWTLGGGVEYAFTNNLTAKAEYLYYDLGNKNYAVVGTNAAAVATGASYSIRQETKGSIVRVGVNYKF